MSLDELGGISAGYGKAQKASRGSRSAPFSVFGGGGGGGGNGGGSSGCRVFVGNLAFSVSWQDLKDHMRKVGDVLHCDVLSDPGTAMGSKGCGIVEFSSPSEAQRAIRELTETELRGRKIFVREDREPPGGGGGGRGGGRADAASESAARRDTPTRGGATSELARRGLAAAGASVRGGSLGSRRHDDDPPWVAARAERGSGGGGGGSRSVFVGNLAYSVTWPELKDHMRQAGDVVHCDIIAEPGTAMGSKGCGLVRYASFKDARRAIRELSETTIRGRPIFVREDREDDDGPPRGGGGGFERERSPPHRGGGCGGGGRKGGGKGSGGGVDCRVFVGNLAFSVTWKELKDHMRNAGEVAHCDIMPDPGTPCGSKGCGIVEFFDPRDARRAIRELSQTELMGRIMFVREDRED